MPTVISVENLSKSYRLGQIGTGTFAQDLNIWWAKLWGKPNPTLKLGESDHGNRHGDEIWALKDVSFTIDQGEVLGIIGKNGAGKSTLLKILSRITAPTSGCVKVKGRVASLLEVGTGFHPELTGRENTYLNGAILGMTREEIDRKFDEIVDFSGVEKFIDTPVKRYSSGMYVRLAFAVAAHLDPEILLVDEVLAVGDAEFQKKCLTKMKELGQGGRTVLFVSHNMTAVTRLCTKAIQLMQGIISCTGPSEFVVNEYLKTDMGISAKQEWTFQEAPGNNWVKIRSVRVVDNNLDTVANVDIRKPVGIEIVFDIYEKNQPVIPMLALYTDHEVHVFNALDPNDLWDRACESGQYTSTAWIQGNLLNEGTMLVTVLINTLSHQSVIRQAIAKEAVSFHVIDPQKGDSAKGKFNRSWGGAISPLLNWTIEKTSIQNRN